jgi:DNA-binding transcriptional regulator YiaG
MSTAGIMATVANHPNRAGGPALAGATPTPDAIRAWRRATGLSAAAAGALVHSTGRVWQQWEAGERRMHPAFWDLAQRKARELGVAP